MAFVQQARGFDLAVVGLGAVGAATLYQAARRGARTIGFDRFDPPHARGSSHGETRITRQAIGEGDAYVPLVRRSHAIWDELAAATGTALIDRCGFLLIARGDAASVHHAKRGFLARTVAAADRHAIAHETLDAAAIAARFPQFQGLHGDEQGYFEPGGGQVFPERCIAAQLAEARRLGAVTLVDTRVTAVVRDGDGVRVEYGTGEAVRAAAAVVATGAWLPAQAVCDEHRALRVYRQTLHWFAVDPARPRGAADPVFIWNHGPNAARQFYGFPSAGAPATLKIGTEQYATTTDPESMSAQVSAGESLAAYRQHAATRLAGIRPAAVRASACAYTVAPDGDFALHRAGAIIHASACSGHGFKHSAGLGEALAAHSLTGGAAIDLAAFGLAAAISGSSPDRSGPLRA